MYSNFKMLKRILKYSKRSGFILFFALLFAIIYVAATLYTPYIIGNEALNLYKEGFIMDDLIKVLIKLVIVISAGALFGYLMQALLNKVTYYIIKDLRIDAFKKVLNVPVSYLDTHTSGDTLTRITNDTEIVADGLLQGFKELFTGIITILVTLIFMMIIKWQIGLIVLCLTPLSMLVAWFIAKKGYKTFKLQASVKGEMGGYINEYISNQRLVICYNYQDKNVKRFEEIDSRLYYCGRDAQFASSLTNPSTRLVNAIVYATVATVGAIFIVTDPSNIMNVGKLSIFLSYASQYTKPFNEISSVATELSNSFASLQRVFELIDSKEIVDESNLPDLEIEEGKFEFKDVSFRYLEHKPLIDNLNLTIESGYKVAIVGPTGCGKTTLINLLMRFYDLNSGAILIDSKNINEYKRDSLRKNIGMVLQDTWLFNGTIYENIAYGYDLSTKEDVIEAAKKAYADEFIKRLPNGYDEVVTESLLSEGQKQLLCIARLMLRKTKIVILDEATSSIDTRTETLVNKAFNELMEGRTSFVIAHRLSTIRNADLILVMKDGHIIEKGTHQSLIEENGFYKTLYYSQFEQ